MSGLQRPVRIESDEQEALFDMSPDWRRHWWGMPSFEMGDARPQYRVTVNFMTRDDLMEFGRQLGIRVSTSTDTAWFPAERLDRPGSWEYGVDES